jgi:excisionase family DNA binding protein
MMNKEQSSAESPHLNPPESHLKDLTPWMTTQEAAEHSGYDIEHVRRLARQGKIGAVKKGRDWWIDVEQFTAYLNMMLDSGDGRAGPKPPRQETS